MATIIITGFKGQLGRALSYTSIKHPQHEIIGIDIDDLNLTDFKALKAFLKNSKADFLINCAAFTAVDNAELDPKSAYMINGEAVRSMAIFCSEFNIKFIHISTDYVFDGSSTIPIIEETPTNPLSVYGQSKLDGEVGILYNAKDALIIRTSWLYYHGCKNFIYAILNRANQNKPLQVVVDQAGSPTYAYDLAEAIWGIIDSKRKISGVSIYHYTNQGIASWYDFAHSVIEYFAVDAAIEPVSSAIFPTKAIRPSYSVLNCDKIITEYKLETPYWRNSLKRFVEIEKSNNI